MPTFKERIEDLSGTIPATADGEQFVKDGVHDVIHRMTVVAPDHADLFSSEVAVADGGTSVDSTHILGVHRDNSSCRLIASASRHSAVDSASIHYATASDPVYYVLDQSIYVKPAGGSSVEASIVKEGAVTNWDAGSSAIANFPDDNYHQVIMYAAMQVLHHRMVVSTMPTDLTLETVPSLSISATVPTAPTLTTLNYIAPVIGTINAVSYSGPSSALDVAAITNANAGAILGISTPPVYNSGAVVGFDNDTLFWNLAELNVNDLNISVAPPVPPGVPDFTTPTPAIASATGTFTKTLSGSAPIYSTPSPDLSLESFDTFSSSFANLSISAVPPTAPALPSFTTPDISSVSLQPLALAPVYTAPTIATTAFTTGTPDDLTDMVDADQGGWGDSLDFDFDGENIDFQTWFQAAGAMIQNQEDIELASMQLQKIAAYVNSYGVSMQNRLNQFNDANTEYQASIQVSMQNAQIAAQEAQGESNLLLQKENQEYAAKLGKYQAEVGEYSQKVNTEIGQYTQNLGKLMQTWSGEQQNELARYGAKMQNNLNHFNAASAEYQASLQRDLAELNSQVQADISKMNKSTDVDIQAKAQVLQEESSEFTAALSIYQAQLQQYQQDIGKEVQQYQANSQKDITIFQAEQQMALQQHTQLMADAMNLFNDANTEYQSTLQEAIQRAQLENSVNLANMQKDLQIAVRNEDKDQERVLTNAVQTMQAIVSDNGNVLAKYQAEVQNASQAMSDDAANNQNDLAKYQAEIGAYQQELSAEMGEYGQNMQRVQKRIALLYKILVLKYRKCLVNINGYKVN